MALSSVTKAIANPSATSGSTYPLWLTDENVLDITLDRNGMGFPPEISHVVAINSLIQDLARATCAVIHCADQEDQSGLSAEFLMQPVKGIADTILLLTKLSEAIHAEISVSEGGAQ